MKPSEIRTELLRQHAEVRARGDDALRAVDHWRGNAITRNELREAIGRLADVLQAHNKREEDVLRDVLPTIDAWGKERSQVMLAEHLKEHSAIGETLLNATYVDDPAKAQTLIHALVARILEHMTVEERSFLTEDVLKDDLINVAFGG